MAKNKRSRKFIDNQVQGIMVWRLLTHWVVFVLAVTIVSAALQVLLRLPTASLLEALSAIGDG